MNPDIMEAIEEQLKNDETIKEMAWNQKGMDEPGYDRDD